jgi:hypothetical protein
MLLENTGDIDLAVEESPLNDLLKLHHAEVQERSASQIAEDVSSLLVGEVMDTHHPDLPRFLYVRWIDGNGAQVERWLQRTRGIVASRGDRVLLEQPANWPEKLVTAVLDDGSKVQPVESTEKTTVNNPSLQLRDEQCVTIVDVRNQPLLEIHSSSNGPIVRLMNQNATFEVPGKLRFQANTIEFEGGRGGVDIRTEADTVVRSRFIRLN